MSFVCVLHHQYSSDSTKCKVTRSCWCQVMRYTAHINVLLCFFWYCRQKDKKNQLKYRQHLENIKKRVEARPLLLEQASSHSTDIARANYTTALTKVGFSKEEIEALLNDIDRI